MKCSIDTCHSACNVFQTVSELADMLFINPRTVISHHDHKGMIGSNVNVNFRSAGMFESIG